MNPHNLRQVAKKSYHHGDLRRALVDAGLRLIAKRGVEGFTLRETARVAGVSQTAPYRHFPDKAALLAAVAEEGFRGMAEYMKAATAPHALDPARRFGELGVAYV